LGASQETPKLTYQVYANTIVLIKLSRQLADVSINVFVSLFRLALERQIFFDGVKNL
jgi:hypothetical protein